MRVLDRQGHDGKQHCRHIDDTASRDTTILFSKIHPMDFGAQQLHQQLASDQDSKVNAATAQCLVVQVAELNQAGSLSSVVLIM